MPLDRASRTAEFMALFRSLESVRSPDERLFADPLARDFLPRPLKTLPTLARARPLRRGVVSLLDLRWPGARASGVARTRAIDDYVRAALADGIEQIVILGAGFDARAYRIEGIERAWVVEVDRPDTQEAKKTALRARLGVLPGHVAFLPLDLGRVQLHEELLAAGLRPGEPAFFVWEGVTNYLREESVDATLRSISAAGCGGSRLVFTYVHRGLLDGSLEFPGGKRILAKVRSDGEPWTFGLEPDAVAAYLDERGLRLLEDLGSLDYRARLMPPRGRHMRGYEFYRLALAETA
jgi:methyltransferase (TIGR00027 family)